MAQTTLQKRSTLLVELSGEIDHNSADGIRRDIDERVAVSAPKRLVLDFSRVTFMDSSGIGMVLNRYRGMKQRGGELIIKNPSRLADRIFSLAGIYEICHKEEA